MIISIIVPLYRGNIYINQLIKMVQSNAVMLKTYKKNIDLELILVNDYPTEKIDPIIENVGFTIVIAENKYNMGIHRSRLNGLSRSNGEYIIFLDQDDEISDDYVMSQLEHLKNADLVVCNAYKETDRTKYKLYKNNFQINCVKKLYLYCYMRNQIISPGQCLVKKSAIPIEWTKFILINNGVDDLFLWILMLAERKNFALNKRILYTHRYTGTNLSDEYRKMDSSIDELLSYLYKIPYIPCEIISSIKKHCKFKHDFRFASFDKRVILALTNIKYVISYILYYICSAISCKI